MNGCDALVIGGEPAGATAALLLARAGWNVALVERQRFPRGKVCGEFISATTWHLLRELRLASASPHSRAGDAVFEHVRKNCRGVRIASARARVDRAWMSAGPIHPGMRQCSRDDVYVIGNAAGEAHPIVAEGISMAIQSAVLLCALLEANASVLSSREAARCAAVAYEKRWHQQFALRLHAAAFYAALAMSPFAARAVRGVLAHAPALLTWGARCCGKIRAPYRCEGAA